MTQAMARQRTGQVYVERHGDHWDIRFDLPTGGRSKRCCMPMALDLGQAKSEARRAKSVAWASIASPPIEPPPMPRTLAKVHAVLRGLAKQLGGLDDLLHELSVCFEDEMSNR